MTRTTARPRGKRDELVDSLLSALSPAEVLRRYSVAQLARHLCERVEAEGALPAEAVDVLRTYVDAMP